MQNALRLPRIGAWGRLLLVWSALALTSMPGDVAPWRGRGTAVPKAAASVAPLRPGADVEDPKTGRGPFGRLMARVGCILCGSTIIVAAGGSIVGAAGVAAVFPAPVGACALGCANAFFSDELA